MKTPKPKWLKYLLLVVIIALAGYLIFVNLFYDVPSGPPYTEEWVERDIGGLGRGGGGIVEVPTKYYDQVPLWARIPTEYGFILIIAIICLFILYRSTKWQGYYKGIEWRESSKESTEEEIFPQEHLEIRKLYDES